MSKTVLISGASTGFGALTARALADAGYMVYAGMRDVSGHNKEHAGEAAQYSRDHQVTLTAVELDVTSEDSVQQATRTVLAGQPLDVLIHNAGHMVTGPAEAFTAGQLAELYDTNVLGTLSATPSSWPGSASRPRSSCRDRSPTARVISRTAASRVHIDPADDGAAVVNAVGDRIRAEFLRRIGLAGLLHPSMA